MKTLPTGGSIVFHQVSFLFPYSRKYGKVSSQHLLTFPRSDGYLMNLASAKSAAVHDEPLTVKNHGSQYCHPVFQRNSVSFHESFV